jgi:hypothetical protein
MDIITERENKITGTLFLRDAGWPTIHPSLSGI